MRKKDVTAVQGIYSHHRLQMEETIHRSCLVLRAIYSIDRIRKMPDNPALPVCNIKGTVLYLPSQLCFEATHLRLLDRRGQEAFDGQILFHQMLHQRH